MLDAFIINEIRKEEDAQRWRKGQQPFLPVPDRMPYAPPKREEEPGRRGYYDSESNDFDPRRDARDDCVIEMGYVTRVKYVV